MSEPRKHQTPFQRPKPKAPQLNPPLYNSVFNLSCGNLVSSFILYPKDYKLGSVHYAAYITVKALASCLVLIIGDTTMLIRQGPKNGLSEYYYNFLSSGHS